jgi:hypothetical protein
MRKIPFCSKCAFYGGRVNGIGTCNQGVTPYKSEHIGTSEFWCIKGVYKNCESCKYYDERWSNRCLYCKSNKDEVGQLTEWVLKASTQRGKE